MVLVVVVVVGRGESLLHYSSRQIVYCMDLPKGGKSNRKIRPVHISCNRLKRTLGRGNFTTQVAGGASMLRHFHFTREIADDLSTRHNTCKPSTRKLCACIQKNVITW